MKKRLLTTLVAGALLAGCAANGSSSTPNVTQANIANDTLQFAVGTANVGASGNTIVLNTIVTFRQPNGNSAVLVDTPTITGPAAFVVPAVASAGTDAGTNHISGTPQTLVVSPTPTPTTFNQSGGAFSFGFGPFNIGSTSAARYPGNPSLYTLPFYAPAQRFVGGPPAYPFFNDGTYPANFQGYSQGFTDFAATPVLGSYNLSVAVVAANAPSQTFSVNANLATTVALPAQPAPTFIPDGAGGGSGIVTVVPGAVEAMVYVRNVTKGTWFTAGPIKATGPYVLPPKLGVCGGAGGTGCQNSATTQTPTLNTGDTFQVYAVSYNFPMFESSPPGNTSAAPVITGANGQADISSSPSVTLTY